MRSRCWLTLCALLPTAALAWGDECALHAERSDGIDAKGADKVVIRAGAGNLKVTGRAGSTRVDATGRACASKQAVLDAVQISVRREGNIVYVETTLPQDDADWSWGKNQYAYLDIDISLPSTLPVDAIDSSGEASFADLHSLEVQDSSGNLRISRIAGTLSVGDSSGDVDIDNSGSLRLRDSSGDVEINNIRGNVEVLVDSSGNLRIRNVDGQVDVDQDSSGDIRIEDVKGSVSVDSDSSGGIYARRVGGDFTVGSDSSGSIEHESVRGKVSVPPHHGTE